MDFHFVGARQPRVLGQLERLYVVVALNLDRTFCLDLTLKWSQETSLTSIIGGA